MNNLKVIEKSLKFRSSIIQSIVYNDREHLIKSNKISY